MKIKSYTRAQVNVAGMFTQFQKAFERCLWAARLAMLVGVFASLLVCFIMLFVTTIDVIHIVKRAITYGTVTVSIASAGARGAPVPDATQLEEQRTDTVVHIVQSIDGYLLAAIMLIFAFGLYELFVSEIDQAKDNKQGSRLLDIKNLDDLKHRLGQVAMLILVVKFFESAVQIKFSKPIDLLYLGIGIVLTAGALYLGYKKEGHP